MITTQDQNGARSKAYMTNKKENNIRSFSETLKYFATAPKLKYKELFSSGKQVFFNCKKESEETKELCGHKNRFTNLVCESCTQSPGKINPIWWFFIVVLVFGFWTSYLIDESSFYSYQEIIFGQEEPQIIFNKLLLPTFVFIGFLGFFTGFTSRHIFKFPSKSDAPIILILFLTGFVFLVAVTLPVIGGEFYLSICFFVVLFLLIAGFVLGLIIGGIKFCKINQIHSLVPFFLVLPINYLILSLFLSAVQMIPALSALTENIKGLVESFLAPEIMNVFETIIKFLSISIKARIIILAIYLGILILVFSYMPASKADRKKGSNTLEIIQQFTRKFGENLKNILSPLWQTIFYINLYAFTSTFMTPILLGLCLGLFYILLVLLPTGTEGIVLIIGSVVSLAFIYPLLSAFILRVAQYNLSLTEFMSIFTDLFRGSFFIIFFTSIVLVILGIASIFTVEQYSITSILIGGFFIIGIVIATIYKSIIPATYITNQNKK